ncbi:SGNH/GDSL hydrolase family protein [Paenibacillus sp. P25]|nr:SGNH/GDSL hydrolase family protein [Paenibacillus sp. P25]
MLNGKIVSLTLAAMLFSTAAPLLASAAEPGDPSAASVTASAADTAAPQWPQSIRYLALGDSLAAGMTPTGGLDKSYADYLAASLQAAGYLTGYERRYAYPGYTTDNVLADLKANVTKSVYGGSRTRYGRNPRLCGPVQSDNARCRSQ